MSKWKAKSCPRCGGDIFLDMDEYNSFDHCLQCGYVRNAAGISCPRCGQEMANELDGYKCDYCGHASKAPTPAISWDG